MSLGTWACIFVFLLCLQVLMSFWCEVTDRQRGCKSGAVWIWVSGFRTTEQFEDDMDAFAAVCLGTEQVFFKETSRHFQPCLYFKPNHDVFLTLTKLLLCTLTYIKLQNQLELICGFAEKFLANFYSCHWGVFQNKRLLQWAYVWSTYCHIPFF